MGMDREQRMTDRGTKRGGPSVSSNFNRLCFRRALIDREIGNGRRWRSQVVHARIRNLSYDHIVRITRRRLVTDSMPDRAFIAKEFFRKRVVEKRNRLRSGQISFLKF